MDSVQPSTAQVVSFGHLPPTEPGVYYNYDWLKAQLQADAAEQAYEGVLTRLSDLTIAMSVLVRSPIALSHLSFKLGPVQSENEGCTRVIHVFFNGYQGLFKSAQVHVFMDEKTGELQRCFNVLLTCHDDR